MEEWPAFHQYSPIWARTSGPISVLEQPSLPQTLIGESSFPWSSNSRFLGFRIKVFFFFEVNGMEEWSAFHQYSPILARTSGPISVLEQPSLLQTLIGESLPPWASNSRFLGFQKPFGLFCRGRNGMEEWSAFHQYSHFLAIPSGPISVLDQPILLQTLIGGPLIPWSWTERSYWFSQESSFFYLMKTARKNGRHSTNIPI